MRVNVTGRGFASTIVALLAVACGDARDAVDTQATQDPRDGSVAESTGGTTSSGGAAPSDGGAGGSSAGGSATGGTRSTDAATIFDAGLDAVPADCPMLPRCGGCPYGLWDDTEGCPTCACAPPPLQLIVDGESRPPEHLSLETVAWTYIGGVDQWVFDFTFRFDDPATADEEEELSVGTRLQILFTDPITEDSATYFYPTDSPPLATASGTYTLFGFAQLEATVVQVSGYFSVRQEGDRFVGGVYFEFEPFTGTLPGPIVASGPFDVLAPEY